MPLVRVSKSTVMANGTPTSSALEYFRPSDAVDLSTRVAKLPSIKSAAISSSTV